MAKKPAARSTPWRPYIPQHLVPHIGGVALILGLLLAVYLPALEGGLLWDDDAHIPKLELQSFHGLWRVWTEIGATPQYYPLLHTAFWIEHQLWGDAVTGYHLTNLMLHAVSAWLVVLIVRRLGLPGAWLAGLIFALHPVQVETVAWISEQKNALSTAFYLGSALTYLHFDRTRRRAHYFLALAFFLAALLSKTVTATLPAVLLVILWWQHGRLSRKRDVAPLIPWLTLGVAAGLLSAWVERKLVGAEGTEFMLTLTQRLLLAGRAIWFYLGKLVWPVNLTFIYPRWDLNPRVWWQYLFLLGVLAAAAAGVWLAARGRRGPLAALLFFVGTLVPVLGFLNVYPFLFSYVADHFQYVAALGVIVPAAAVLTRAAGARARLAGGVLVTVLAILAWNQAGLYRDAETLYRETVARNPGSWMAHNNLAGVLMHLPGRAPEAVPHLEAALRLKPDMAEAHNNLGLILSDSRVRLPDAIAEFQTAIKIKPDYPEAHNNLGSALSEVPGRSAEAVAEYEAALRLAPDYAEAHNNLGSALSEMPGRLPDAITEFEAALRSNPNLAEAQANLGVALTKVPNRMPEAVSHLETALRIRPDMQPVRQLLAQLRSAQTGAGR